MSDVNRECQECGGYEMNDGVSELCLCHDDEDDLVYIESLEIKIKELEQRLKEAETALSFYAGISQPLNGDDNELCNQDLTNIYYRGGKRARAYFEKYGEKETNEN